MIAFLQSGRNERCIPRGKTKPQQQSGNLGTEVTSFRAYFSSFDTADLKDAKALLEELK